MGYLNLGTPDAVSGRGGDGCAGQGYHPICATNGKTYDNRCYMMAAGATFKYYGPCSKDKDDKKVVCCSDKKFHPNAASCTQSGGTVKPSNYCKNKVCAGKDGKYRWYESYAAANKAGAKIDSSGKKCGGSPGPPGGPTGPSGSAQIPGFYDYLPGLTDEIEDLYAQLDEQNLKDVAVMQGLYNHIAPDVLESYKLSLAENRKRLGEMQGLMDQVPGVIGGFLDGSAVDPVVADAINRAVGLTGSQATLAGAPIQQNSYLTQAATRAGTEAAAPIKLGAQQAGVNMLGQFGGMSEAMTAMPFGPQLAGLGAGQMMQGAQQNLLMQRALPMQIRLGLHQPSSNLMGNAINQMLAPLLAGAGIGSLWSPYGTDSGYNQYKKVTPLPPE